MYSEEELKLNNLINEGFECLATIFRLAGNSEYAETDNIYQKKVELNFRKFQNHPAVKYAYYLRHSF